jgi:HD-GYP domain-containing protein (c-di-GMP phosphodiesterase class II)
MRSATSSPNAVSRRVLLVGSDSKFQQEVRAIVEAAGFSIVAVPTTKAAQEQLTTQRFEAAISELWSNDANGIELAKFASEAARGMPVVLVETALGDPARARDARAAGARAVLFSPLKKSALISALQAPIDAESIAEYCRVSLTDLLALKVTAGDVFVRATAGNFMKFLPKGAVFPPQAAKALRASNVRHLYMRKEDYRRSLGFALALSHAAQVKDALDANEKLQLLRNTGEIILEHLYFDEVEQESLEAAHSVVESVIAAMSDDPKIFGLLKILNGYQDTHYAHCLGVSLFSNLIARQLDWTSNSTTFKLTTAGLMHDIALAETPPELLTKSESEMTEVEKKQMQAHVARTAELLSGIPSIPNEVVQIVLQHQEKFSGDGYPMGKKGHQIHPLARVIAVADRFSELTIRARGSARATGLSPQTALQQMVIPKERAAFDPAPLGALMRAFKVELPTDIASSLPKGWRHI